MEISLKKLPQALLDLDKKLQDLDEIIKDVRVEINNVLWDLVELKTKRNVATKENKS